MALYRLWQELMVRGMPLEYNQSEVTHCPLSTQVRRQAWPRADISAWSVQPMQLEYIKSEMIHCPLSTHGRRRFIAMHRFMTRVDRPRHEYLTSEQSRAPSTHNPAVKVHLQAPFSHPPKWMSPLNSIGLQVKTFCSQQNISSYHCYNIQQQHT
jgi:hypothetical protein